MPVGIELSRPARNVGKGSNYRKRDWLTEFRYVSLDYLT